jgi:hypothetical protein
MSRPRSPRARGALAAALPTALLVLGASLLSACSTSGGTSAGSAAAGSAAGKPTAAAGGAASAGYVLDPPASIAGWSRVSSPDAQTVQKMQQGLTQAEQTVGGVTGTPVYAVYNDTQDQAWVVFVGVNGSGLDPQRLAQAAAVAPEATMDDLGDRLTTSWVPGVAGGPHGGQTQCQQTLIQQAGLATYAATGLAATGSACFWMTPTTFGVVTLYPQANRSQWDFGWNGQQTDAYLLKVRAAVEQTA